LYKRRYWLSLLRMVIKMYSQFQSGRRALLVAAAGAG